MGFKSACEGSCPIGRALGLVGERWTLLIVRELADGAEKRFEDLRGAIGISTHLLASRLRELEAHGVIERLPYSEHPPRFAYRATAKGEALVPVLHLLGDWESEWGRPAPRRRMGSEAA